MWTLTVVWNFSILRTPPFRLYPVHSPPSLSRQGLTILILAHLRLPRLGYHNLRLLVLDTVRINTTDTP